jgi:hypothetical protein
MLGAQTGSAVIAAGPAVVSGFAAFGTLTARPTAVVRAGEHSDREEALKALVDDVTSVAHWLEQKRSR